MSTMYCRFCGRLMDTYIGDECTTCQKRLPRSWNDPPADNELQIVAFKALTGQLSEIATKEEQEFPLRDIPQDPPE